MALISDITTRYMEDRACYRRLSMLADRCPDLDDGFCARVANRYDSLASSPNDPEVRRLYLLLREETRQQYEAIVDGGVEVRPWTAPGQPYENARDLCEKVNRTGTLHIFLTAVGHGPNGERDLANPMLEECGISAHGAPLVYNDLLRAVHDFFGHYLRGDHFTLRGELRAAFNHFQMYSEELHPVVFNEFVAQICWFYCGPHLVNSDGVIPRRGQAGWLAPHARPYPEQKVSLFPTSFVADFLSRSTVTESAGSSGNGR